MITAFRTLTRQWQYTIRRWMTDPRIHTALRILQCLASGFLISAASLGQYAQPLAFALVCSCTGWSSLLTAMGAAAGYWLFWPSFGLHGTAWLLSGLVLTLIAGVQPALRTKPLLLSALAGLTVAASGLTFLLRLQDSTPVLIYLLRIGIALGGTWLFLTHEQNRSQMISSTVRSVWVLSLAQVAPFPWLGLGFLAAGAIAAAESFPAMALAGLALDLAQVTAVPMTAVLCLIFFLRRLPQLPKWSRLVLPAAVYPLVAVLSGEWDWLPFIPFSLGGLLGHFLNQSEDPVHRRSETGAAQVRLELTSGVFSQVQMLLLEATPAPIDEGALVTMAAERACGGCPCRKTCKERLAAAALPSQILHRPLLDSHDLTIICRKEGRLLQEFHRAQEQLRSLRASREQQKESRSAIVQQYQFLAEYLQDLSDELGRRIKPSAPRYKPQISIHANRLRPDNGDRCLSFPGTLCRHYVLLCDGMGTGSGAIDEGRNACTMLKQLLSAGFPPEYALRSLNSLCALRGLAGAVTVDLAQLQLDTGKVLLYKWGAAPSYLLTHTGAEKIGTAGPPPGLSVTDQRETVERLSLRRGETLVLVSDGVGEEEALRCCLDGVGRSPGELAAGLLTFAQVGGEDDATVITVRLRSSAMGT